MSQQSTPDDDATWRAEQGIPTFADEFVQKYLDGRDALVQEEKKQRSDYHFRQHLSPIAAEACAIVDQIRFEEQQTLWTAEFEDSLANSGETDIYPGMMFSLAKERMERSKLWKIIRRMPKGTLLHCHLEAMVDLDWAIEEAFNTPGMCIQAAVPLAGEEALKKGDFFFIHAKPKDPQRTAEELGASLWTDAYPSNTPIPITAAAGAFPGGRTAFVEWVRTRCTITPEESLQHHGGVNEVWRKFLSCFPILGSLIMYEPICRQFIRKMCKQLLDDGVQYVEVRSAFFTPYVQEGSETPDQDYANFLGVMIEEVDKFKSTEEGKDFWGVRVIWTSVRILDTRAIHAAMNQCIRMKILYPNLICGYDFVGQEDRGRPLADLVPEIFYFKKACLQSGVDIPFFFHAGECLGDGDSTDENLFDAVLLGTRRIGHGFSLFKHPLLIDMIKERKILIESCPVSNEVLRLTTSILSHPIPALLARGVPVALCNDDPTILGQGANGMTHDFWQALQGWENLGLAGLGSVAENSVRWAAYEDMSAKEWSQDVRSGSLGKGLKAQRLKEWMRSWERYCHWIVDEYGQDVNLNPEE